MEETHKILKGDKYIWGAYFALCFISIIAMYSASGTLSFKGGDTFDPILRHTIYLILGTILVYLIHLIHYKYFRMLGFPLFVVSCILLVYALFFGEKVNDASRWVSLMGIKMQPSELAKMGVVISVAFFLAKGQIEKGVAPQTFSKLLAVIGISCLLIFTENFSTALLLGIVSFCMMLIGGVQIKKLVALLLIALMFVGGILFAAHKLDKGEGNETAITKIIHRANTWNDRLAGFSGKDGLPEYMEKTNDDNYQEHHARMAIAHSRGIGIGPGNSRERDFLPQAYSDFIYAIIIEESGILGGLAVMVLYLSILFRALRNAKKCTRAFPAFLILGIAMLIVFQAIINMSVATGLIPVTGQPLPLISRGGTSIVITCCYFGMMLSISRFATTEGLIEEKMEGSTEPHIPEDISAPNPNLTEN
ncbi:MAG: FtsW/RodA/SpoVE family cell cycle protein [Bacteroidales bacterium]